MENKNGQNFKGLYSAIEEHHVIEGLTKSIWDKVFDYARHPIGNSQKETHVFTTTVINYRVVVMNYKGNVLLIYHNSFKFIDCHDNELMGPLPKLLVNLPDLFNDLLKEDGEKITKELVTQLSVKNQVNNFLSKMGWS